MSKKVRIFFIALLILVAAIITIRYISNADIAVLRPNGPVGQKERNLIVLAVSLSLIVFIPVYLMLIGFAWRYRASNKKARYDPHFSHSRIIESVWWGVPLVIITALAVVTWRSSHQLDPFKSLAANQKQITIQVVALNWKWLFIYPEQNIASVNLVEFPQNTPVEFNITADAPMNSFWIPQLGGQIYAMSGMTTRLNLMADRIGTYHGASANISGKGFAGMEFLAKSVSAADYNSWIKQISKTNNSLSLNNYNKLAVPSMNNPVSYYSSVENGLYEGIVNKFTNPGLPVSQPLIQSGED